MKKQDETEKLHEQASKLTSDELIHGLAIVTLSKGKLKPETILVIKIYLKRALEREGVK